jgi:peptidoglycan/xylan/chitin deacetylase (PgdA/CDA1 family)
MLTRLGIEIGAHSRTHRPMNELGAVECLAEAKGALRDLVDSGLPSPRYFAYPYGACNEEAVRATRAAGYLAAFGVQTRLVDRSSDTHCLPRVAIGAADRGWRFWLKTSSPRLFEWVDLNLRRALKVIGVVAPPRVA